MCRNNDFFFQGEVNSQLRCPFAAHVRKTNPRNDLEDPPAGNAPAPIESRRIMRRGIQFGPELTRYEHATGKTEHGRGLLFACYQSSITNGFQFLQNCEQAFAFRQSIIDGLLRTTQHGRTQRNSLHSRPSQNYLGK